MNLEELKKLSKLIRYWILKMTTEAGSGHPTSSLSAVELMVGLMFGAGFKYKLMEPGFNNNDRLIFSKGHASPLFYALWAAIEGSVLTEDELVTLRKFNSHLEGHPTMRFPYTEVATGSLGQGLSVGVGMALNAKLDKLDYRTYVLLGDSEMAEGSNWEAMQLAAHYKLNNLVAILDVNRLGQRGETMYGWDVDNYSEKVKAFGWKMIKIDGHDLPSILSAYNDATTSNNQPSMIVAKTVKGKGVSFLENKEGWHGKALTREELTRALSELGEVDENIRGKIHKPKALPTQDTTDEKNMEEDQGDLNQKQDIYEPTEMVATRQAYGRALRLLANRYPQMVVLDAEVSNSTHAEEMKKVAGERFFEMYIAEQNMVGTALGFSKRDKIPMVSTFAAFFARAFDQIRMSQYSKSNIKFIGSHGGVSIGEDGASQMGLEDLSMFRSIQGSVVLYPSDAISTIKLLEEAMKHKGNVYIRTTRMKTPILYGGETEFKIGGSKILKKSDEDKITLIGAGVTLHEALRASKTLEKEGVKARVIDLYSVKPLDVETLRKAAKETKAIITVEDHYAEGGIGEAITSALTNENVQVHSLAVRKMPRSGKPKELLAYEEIDAESIMKKVKEVLLNKA